MNNIDKFNDVKKKVLVSLDELKIFASNSNEIVSLTKDIENTKKNINSDKFYVAVVGVIKRGKSTLLNALLNAKEDILSTQVTPETARLAYLTYHEIPHAIIHTKDSQKIEIELNELPKYTSAFDTTSPKGEKAKVMNTLYAEIFYPNNILQKGFCIIDTPGVEDPDETRSEVTLNYIDRADAVIFLMSASEGGLKNSELQFLQSRILNNQGSSKGIIVVLNMISRLRGRQLNEVPKLLEKNEKLLYDTFGKKISIFPLDALDALKGIRTNDAELYEKSKFEIFKNELEKYLVQEKGKLFLRLRINKFLADGLDPIIEHLKAKIAYEPTSLQKIEAELLKSKEELSKVEGAILEIFAKNENTKNDLKNWIQKEIITDFNSQIVINRNSIPNLSRNINTLIESISRKVNNRTQRFIDDIINEFDDEKINISQPNFDVSVKQIDTSKYFVVQKITTASQKSNESAGKVIGGVLGFLAGTFFPPAIILTTMLGMGIGEEFGGSDTNDPRVTENMTIDEMGIKREIDSVRATLTQSLHASLDYYFNEVAESTDKTLQNKKESINNIYNTNKQLLSNEKNNFQNYKDTILKLINQINHNKNKFTQLLQEVETI